MRVPVTAVIAVFRQAGIPYPTGSLFDQFIIYEIVKQLPCLLVHRKLNDFTITENNFSRVIVKSLIYDVLVNREAV